MIFTCITRCTRQSSAYVPLCVHGNLSNLGSRATLILTDNKSNLKFYSGSSSQLLQSIQCKFTAMQSDILDLISPILPLHNQ